MKNDLPGTSKGAAIPCDGCGKSSTRRVFWWGPTKFLCDSCGPDGVGRWCPGCQTFHTGARPGTKTTVEECPLQRSLAEERYARR